MFRTDAQRKAMFANMNEGGSGSPKPADGSNYKPPVLHKSSEPKNAVNVNVPPSSFHYPDKSTSPSYSTRSNLSHDIKEITRKDDALHDGRGDFDNYKKDVNEEMDNRFDSSYHKVVKKAAKEYRKEL